MSGAGVKVGGNVPCAVAVSDASAAAIASVVDSSEALGASVGSSADAGWQAPTKIARTIKGMAAAAGRLRRNRTHLDIGLYSAAKGRN